MKQRVISSVVGLCILAVVFATFNSIFLNISAAIVIVAALWELISAFKLQKSPVSVVAVAFGAMIPFFRTTVISSMLPAVCLSFSLLLFIIFLKMHDSVKFQDVALVFFLSIMVAFSITCFIYLRDIFGYTIGLYGMVLSMGSAWMSDTGAYFFGIAFGKHKLAPKISPNKTVEGLLGGFFVGLISMQLFTVIFIYAASFWGVKMQVNFVALAIITPFLSAISVVGDLCASAIKRQIGIKDFGKIMPGHGGVVDRFDSVFFVVPLVLNIFVFLPFVRIL